MQEPESDIERRALRLLHGELPAAEARELSERPGHDPAFAATYRRLEAVWNGLAPPPANPVPIGFTGRVMAHVREQAAARAAPGLAGPAGPFSWAAAPRWVRTTGAAALLTGLLLGAGLGLRTGGTGGTAAFDDRTGAQAASEPALAESYWALMGAADDTNQ